MIDVEVDSGNAEASDAICAMDMHLPWPLQEFGHATKAAGGKVRR